MFSIFSKAFGSFLWFPPYFNTAFAGGKDLWNFSPQGKNGALFKNSLKPFQAFLSLPPYTAVKAQGAAEKFKKTAEFLHTFDTIPRYHKF
ncbi:MAG: hypothetical protein Q4C45_01520 [Oscillospiraceae bacterium]|nr:hypothetical protein [Oscillospiraceae bacterium]